MKTVTIPLDFDGAKFAARYGLGMFDFRLEGGTLYYPDHLPDEPVLETTDPANVRAQTKAVAHLDGADQAQFVLLRGLALVAMDEINLLRQWVTDFKAQVALASSLADLRNRVATLPDLPARQAAQIKTAIRNRIGDGSAD